MEMSFRTSSLVAIVFFTLLLIPTFLHALTAKEIRELRLNHRIMALLVFGDSSVDPGNNNRLATNVKSNFLPYGKDFMGGRPTGRFSNGKLATDFIADALGLGKAIAGFLDPNITKDDLLHAISFASAGSGYDELTSNLTRTISMSGQVKYLRHYKIHLRKLVGYKKAEDIIRKSGVIVSTGTNDYLQNYFLEPIRPKQFTLEKYQDFLVSQMRLAIQGINKVGAERVLVVGVPPLGCMPLVMAFQGDGVNCVEKVNKAVISLNSKLQKEVKAIQNKLKMRIIFIDVYEIVDSAINNPKVYGFAETRKGCCGSGVIELGETCRDSETCKDPNKFIFWDAVHPTQRMYKIVADKIMKSLPHTFIH